MKAHEIIFQSLQEEYSRSPTTRLLKEIQETKKHIPQLQEQLSKATGCAQVTESVRLLCGVFQVKILRG